MARKISVSAVALRDELERTRAGPAAIIED
jgi:hypothetical protein